MIQYSIGESLAFFKNLKRLFICMFVYVFKQLSKILAVSKRIYHN